jgi:hypothetical protein
MEEFNSCPMCGNTKNGEPIYRCQVCYSKVCPVCRKKHSCTVSATSKPISNFINPHEIGKINSITSIQSENLKSNSSNSTVSYYSRNWWEYESEENFFKTIFLFPLRLIIWIIGKIIEFIETILKAIVAFLQTFIGIPYIFITLSITLGIMLPARIVVYILSFGNKTLWEDELFDWLGSAMRWSVYLWNEFEHDFFKVLKVLAIIFSITSWLGIIGIV